MIVLVSLPAFANKDIDLDGVLNHQDLCANTPLATAVNRQGCHFKHAGALFTVTFKAGSAWIDGEQTLALRDVAAQLNKVVREFPGAKIAVRGFNGGKSDRSKAENLSLIRARAVMRQLKLSRVPKTAMVVEGLGRATVADDAATARRVDVLVLPWRPQAAK